MIFSLLIITEKMRIKKNPTNRFALQYFPSLNFGLGMHYTMHCQKNGQKHHRHWGSSTLSKNIPLHLQSALYIHTFYYYFWQCIGKIHPTVLWKRWPWSGWLTRCTQCNPLLRIHSALSHAHSVYLLGNSNKLANTQDSEQWGSWEQGLWCLLICLCVREEELCVQT